MSQPKNPPSLNPASFAFTSFNPASFGPTSFSPASGGLIDFLRESTEAALDLSKNLTSAHLPDEFFNVWTRFAEAQFTAAQKYAYQFTTQTLPNMDGRKLQSRPLPQLQRRATWLQARRKKMRRSSPSLKTTSKR